MTTHSATTFSELGLSDPCQKTLAKLGYETPTPVQAQSIPILLAGKDLIIQAQTGTGKTAAFALPILEQIDIAVNSPQALIMAPTRELAIQVAEAFQSYAAHLKGFHVSPIYGGQDYKIQLRALKRGTHVIVGTPGRLMDHLRRGTINCDALKFVVLDEADEMLNMGFVDDIEWILEQIPKTRHTALFSATIPAPIQKIANRYLTDAVKIQITVKKDAVNPIKQYCIHVTRENKLSVLTRFLEVEDAQASIIFTRTKTAAGELAEKLQARGYAATALHGDMNQSQRKRALDQIKSGSLDIIVATDVAARGIDVDRITHVINFDIPFDTESYIHRIGRTGRAGREGKALLFVGPRENRMLKDIERTVGAPIEKLEPPTHADIERIRQQQLMEKITNILYKSKRLGPLQEVVTQMTAELGCQGTDVAAALLYLMQQDSVQPVDEVMSSYSQPEPRERKPKSRSRSRSTSGQGPRERSSSKKSKRFSGDQQQQKAGHNQSGKARHNQSGFKHRKANGKGKANKPARKHS